jgi:diadenosine tetraphosphate (Ap4A) HIT family hydrolase
MLDSHLDLCPFCAIPPERVIESTEHAFTMLDAYPVSPGHTLVVTRRHVKSPFELTAQEFTEVTQLLLFARDRLDRTLRPSGYNVGINFCKDAGQTVIHVHVHLIPRYPGDTADPTGGVRNVIPGQGRYG